MSEPWEQDPAVQAADLVRQAAVARRIEAAARLQEARAQHESAALEEYRRAGELKAAWEAARSRYVEALPLVGVGYRVAAGRRDGSTVAHAELPDTHGSRRCWWLVRERWSPTTLCLHVPAALRDYRHPLCDRGRMWLLPEEEP